MLLHLFRRLIGRPSSHANAARSGAEQPPALATGQPAALADSESLLGAGLEDWRAQRKDEARRKFAEAARIAPSSLLPHFYLGNCAVESGQFDAALEHYTEALRIEPANSRIYANLSVAHLRRADAQSAIAALRKAIELDPDYRDAHQSLLFALHYSEQLTPAEITGAHRAWGRAFCSAATDDSKVAPVNPEPGRALRIGYVSGDFRQHSVAAFFEAIAIHHDRQSFQVVCYHTAAHADVVTARLKAAADTWRDIDGMPDEDAVRLIQADRIDLLVDLSGHTVGNRLGVFARRAAPVQLTYLGYPGTTGVPAMDFRITDAATDPPGAADALHTERVLRLPGAQWCYWPDSDLPECGPLPAQQCGHVTFGSFNDFSKAGDPVLHAWGEILHRLPGSRLRLLRTPGGQRVQRAQALLAEHGVAAERLDWVVSAVSRPSHAERFAGVDIALDTFPINGVTTTVECLWMGIPVISVHGGNCISRSGLSLLRAVGLPDLATGTVDDYVAAAVALANDHPRLTEIRRNLRGGMRVALADAPRFVASLEELYRSAWRIRTAELAG